MQKHYMAWTYLTWRGRTSRYGGLRQKPGRLPWVLNRTRAPSPKPPLPLRGSPSPMQVIRVLATGRQFYEHYDCVTLLYADIVRYRWVVRGGRYEVGSLLRVVANTKMWATGAYRGRSYRYVAKFPVPPLAQAT